MVGSIRLSAFAAFADGGQQNGIIDLLHWRRKKGCCVRAPATKRRRDTSGVSHQAAPFADSDPLSR